MVHADINSNYTVFLLSILAPAIPKYCFLHLLGWGEAVSSAASPHLALDLDFLFQMRLFSICSAAHFSHNKWYIQRETIHLTPSMGKSIITAVPDTCLNKKKPSAETGLGRYQWVGVEGKKQSIKLKTMMSITEMKGEKGKKMKDSQDVLLPSHPKDVEDVNYLSDYSCGCRYSLSQLPPDSTAVNSYQKQNLNIFIYVKNLNIRC